MVNLNITLCTTYRTTLTTTRHLLSLVQHNPRRISERGVQNFNPI